LRRRMAENATTAAKHGCTGLSGGLTPTSVSRSGQIKVRGKEASRSGESEWVSLDKIDLGQEKVNQGHRKRDNFKGKQRGCKLKSMQGK